MQARTCPEKSGSVALGGMARRWRRAERRGWDRESGAMGVPTRARNTRLVSGLIEEKGRIFSPGVANSQEAWGERVVGKSKGSHPRAAGMPEGRFVGPPISGPVLARSGEGHRCHQPAHREGEVAGFGVARGHSDT